MKALKDNEIKKRLERFSNLQSLPQVIIRIKRISEDPNASAADLANCIISDHQLTSRVLRMANSVFYRGQSRKICTVTRAIVLMGFRPIRNIAVSMGVYQMVNQLSRCGKFDIIAFWIRSLGCGLIAKFLCEKINKFDLIELAFISGFMHDIGEPMLAGAFPREYDEILKLKGGQHDVYKTERVLLGIDHMRAGDIMARRWNLPPELINPIAKHHRVKKQPDEKSRDLLVDIVYLADRIFPYLMSETSQDSSTYATLIKQTQKIIKVSKFDMMDLLSVCRDQMVEIAEDLEVDIESMFDSSKLAEDDTDKMQQEIKSRDMRLSFLYNATDALLEAKSSDEILQVFCEAVYRGLLMGRVILFAFDPKKKSFTGKVGFGLESQQEVQALCFSAQNGLFKEMREQGKAVSVGDENRELLESFENSNDGERLKPLAFVAIPIRILGDVRYVLFVDAPSKAIPVEKEAIRSMVSLASQCAITLERNLFMTKLNLQQTSLSK
ncbi:MAG: HDOD domain-containing protein [candidate division Zixibacteria bacterium]